MLIYLILSNIRGVFEVQALIGKFPSWMEKVTSRAEPSRAEPKIVQLEPARLGLITTTYLPLFTYTLLNFYIFYIFMYASFEATEK